MKQLPDKNIFLKKYDISPERFDATALNWDDLNQVFTDYVREIVKLESAAVFISNKLMKIHNVHSVRYRIKDPEHLIEKIIRKKIQDPESKINPDNYKTAITDLIGLRALHLFKEDWLAIHKMITSTWNLKEKPVANYREGDAPETIKKFQELGCDVNQHKFGYRSIHYIVEAKSAKKTYLAEMQVRTIFEEAWSEIDHTIRYPYDQNNPIFGQFLLILNRLAGSADEMGSFIQFLKNFLEERDKKNRNELIEKENLINQLERKIKDLNIKGPDLTFLTEVLEKLKLPSGSIDFFEKKNQ